jgi:hypothetical protein
MDASPVQCNLDALSPEERAHHAAALKKLGEKALERRELQDGYAYRFAWESGILAELVEWIPLERACCPFFRVSIEVEPGNGAVWLHLTGSGPVKEFIRSEFEGRIGYANFTGKESKPEA